MIRTFEKVIEEVKCAEVRRIAVAMAEDDDIISALHRAKRGGLIEAILVGDGEKIRELLAHNSIAESEFTIEEAPGELQAIERTVSLVKSGGAEVLMKGICSTANFLRAVLHKERGLVSESILSHLAAFEVDTYHKLLLMSDAALNIDPDLKTKIAIVNNAVKAEHKLQITRPKVAVIAAVEKVNPESMPATADAALLAQMAARGQIKNAAIDGPLALDNALSAKSCEVKGIKSDVGGDADIILMPNIETGNSFYKTMTLLAGAKTAGILMGAKVPVVLSSRADSDETKFLSIAFAMLVS